jgi:hypothetical protein
VSLFDLPVYGKIISVDFYRPPSSSPNNNLIGGGNSEAPLDYLFLLTQSRMFCILKFDAATQKVVTKTMGHVKERIGREMERGQRGFFDPDSRVIAMHLYEGLLKVSTICVRLRCDRAFIAQPKPRLKRSEKGER